MPCNRDLSYYQSLYARNSNVFAAMPSLHSAYPLVAFIYSIRVNSSAAWKVSHHYILDVLGGIGCALAGFLIFEYVLMKIPSFRRFIDSYVIYISQ
ncbi:MAG: hypothetical protein K2M39_04095 [Muribaculaceae bacterium]|nr:hypothetical protein [Muribaculaceae bacterium]